MKVLRSLHLHLGGLFASMLLFFAASGLWQMYGNSAQASLLARLLSSIHTGRGLKRFDGGLENLSSPHLRWFAAVMALALVATVLLGVVMAFRFGRGRRALGCLLAGVVVPGALVVGFAQSSPIVPEATASESRSWYEELRPGVTRAEIRALASAPLQDRGDISEYVRGSTRVEFTFRNEKLRQATLFNSPEGGSRSLYSTYGPAERNDPAARRHFLRDGPFAVVPSFAGESIRTNRFDGRCYEIDGRHLVVEPALPLMGAGGFFADKTARVLLIESNGTERLLYRADDHWPDLRPPELSADAARGRVEVLRRAGSGITGREATELLGPGDSNMGSGRDFRLYYLPDGLLVVLVAPLPSAASLRVNRVGRHSISFEQWLTQNQ